MSKKLFNNIFSLRRSRSIGGDGSSRRGRQVGTESDRDEASVRDSSTHSALFDLELSHRGQQAVERQAILASLQAEDGELRELRDPSVHLNGVLQRVIYLGRPLMEFELDLMQDLRSIRELCTDLTGLVLAKVADELHYMGYTVEMRKNNPADPGYRHKVDKGCLEKLRHTYVVCHGRNDGSVQHTCIVDPRFREQFEVGHPSPAYTSLLRAVPMEFVGSPLRLQALVNLLCGEIANAYASQELPLPPWRKATAVLSKWFSPADMAVGAAVAAGTLPLAAGPDSSDVAAEPLQPQQLRPQHAQQDALPAGLPRLPSPPHLRRQHQYDYQQQALPQHQPPLPQPPQPQLGALGLPPGPPTLLSVLAAQQQQRGSPGGECAAPGAAAPEQPGAQGIHFFEALTLHQDSLRRQQQQQAAAAAAAARQAPAEDQRQQHGGNAYPTVVAALAAAAAQVQQQQQEEVPAEGASPPPSGPEHPDARLQDRTNRPRRRLRESQQWHHLSQQAMAAQGLWAPAPDEAPRGEALADGGSGGKVGHNAAGLPVAMGSWTDLSTILETRSAQSSPQSFADLGAMATGGAGAVSRASSESARTSFSRPSAAAASASAAAATHFPSMPVSAFAGPGGPLLLPGAAADGGQQGSSGAGRSKGGKRVVSLLAKGLRSMSQKQTWASLLPNMSSARRQGGSREGSSRGGSRRSAGAGADRSWRGMAGDRSLKDGAYADSGDGSAKYGRQRPPVVPRVLSKS